jgi:signal transduction histidine kinase
MSEEVAATLIGFVLVSIATAIALFQRLTNQVNEINSKVITLEKRSEEDRLERKEQTKVLHNLALSIQKLSSYLEAHQDGFPLNFRSGRNAD